MDRKEPVPSNALRALYVPHCLEHSVSGSTSDVSIDTPYASKMLPMMAAPTLRIRMLETPNYQGNRRRSPLGRRAQPRAMRMPKAWPLVASALT